MEARIVISDVTFEKMIKSQIDKVFEKVELESLIEKKLNAKVDNILRQNISEEKIENFARDRISRIITVDTLLKYTSGLDSKDVLSNIESKILLMIKNSSEFKELVKNTLKESLK